MSTFHADATDRHERDVGVGVDGRNRRRGPGAAFERADLGSGLGDVGEPGVGAEVADQGVAFVLVSPEVAQEPGGGRGRVLDVVRVGDLVAVAVGRVELPGGGDELERAHRPIELVVAVEGPRVAVGDQAAALGAIEGIAADRDGRRGDGVDSAHEERAGELDRLDRGQRPEGDGLAEPAVIGDEAGDTAQQTPVEVALGGLGRMLVDGQLDLDPVERFVVGCGRGQGSSERERDREGRRHGHGPPPSPVALVSRPHAPRLRCHRHGA